MKKLLLLAMLCFIGWSQAQAQIPDGSIAPDFTATDIDGNTYNLYDLLNQGKSVFIDVSATWCGPCWGYHNSHAFRDLWNTYGPPGTDEAFCFYIEGDGSTNTACLYGPSGCVGGTQGDWVTGTPYPIVDDASIAGQYQIAYYPTIFYICPYDKKVYEAGQLSMSGLWAFRNSHCAPPPLTYSIEESRNVRCINTNTGAINISAEGGLSGITYHWSNGAVTQDLNNIPAGTYTVTITSGAQSIVSDPIEVLAPSAPLSAEVVDISPVGCNGVTGSITVSGVGGWDSEYSYVWSNGQTTETATGLGAGTYRFTVTDAEGCTSSLTQALAPAVYPVAQIAAPGVLDCAHQTIQLNGDGSATGDNIIYQWFATNGGHIVSGATTLHPVVDSAGGYVLRVTDDISTCATFLTTTVNMNISYPDANAGPNGSVSCPVPLDTLTGSGSGGSNFSYAWTGPNVVSGGNSLTPVVGASGVYTLAVTNSTNGCTTTSTTTVTGNNTPPSVSSTGGALTCSSNTVTLNAVTNSGFPTFSWTGPNGFTSNLQNPVTSSTGDYTVVVNDTMTGCSNNATATVTADNSGPGASATGGAITCVVDNALVSGTTPDTNATYAWTGPNGFTSNISSFTVLVAGDYNLVVTDPDNGCTSAATATVAANTTPPTASAETPGNLNCNTTQLQLNGTGSSQGNNITYAWSTTNGNIVSGESTQTPLVDAIGSYTLQVTNLETGCVNTATATVIQSPAVEASVPAQQNVTCNGLENGAATAAGLGGNGVYTYVWSNGGTTATINNLAAGSYIVVITDGENCTATATAVVAQPDLLVANASATGQTMSGVNDGTATANPSGGTAPFTYLWSNEAVTQTITELAPGAYSVVVTDVNGCTSVQNVTVNSFDCAIAGTISGTNVTCFNANDGTATVALSGGTAPFTYLWNNGATTQTVNSLAAGVYSVSVADANNCPTTLSIIIGEPNALSANATSTDESSTGANDGTATANPIGGTGAYTYLWSTGATTQSVSGLAPGSYNVQVTDENGCSVTQTVVVNSFDCAIATSYVVTNVSCPSGSNGAATIVLVGGEAPFTYAWSNGGTSATVSNLSAGVYTASVTDANQCQVVGSVTIVEPAPFTAWDVQAVHPVCANDATGAATATIAGGTEPHSFLWSNGVSGNSINNVLPGVYTVQLTDANGCTSQTSVTIAATDNQAPVVTAEDATVALDQSGNVMITTATVNVQASDNCGIASTTITPNTFSCTDLGEQIVTITVTDVSGLSTTTTAKVVVSDQTAPQVTCANDIVVCAYDNFVTYQSATAQDNCLILNGHWDQTSGLPSPSEFPVGTTLQAFSFTDASGNVGTCSFTVTVTPAVQFDGVVISNDLNNLGVGAIDITVTGGVAPFSYLWTLDGQDFATTEDLTGLNAGTYAVAITDANGCVYNRQEIVVSNTVSAKEPSWLSGMSLQPNPTSEQTRIVFAEALNTRLEVSVIDATGRVLKALRFEQAKVITLDCSDLPSGIYTLRFRANQEIGARKLSVIK